MIDDIVSDSNMMRVFIEHRNRQQIIVDFINYFHPGKAALTISVLKILCVFYARMVAILCHGQVRM